MSWLDADIWKNRESLPLLAEPGLRVISKDGASGIIQEISELAGSLAYVVACDDGQSLLILATELTGAIQTNE